MSFFKRLLTEWWMYFAPKSVGYSIATERGPLEDDRDTLVGFQINASPVVRLYARIGENDSFPDIELSSIAEELDRYGTYLSKAAEVVLAWDGEKWCFRYATSDEGEVLGTKECLDYTMDQFNRTMRPRGGE